MTAQVQFFSQKEGNYVVDFAVFPNFVATPQMNYGEIQVPSTTASADSPRDTSSAGFNADGTYRQLWISLLRSISAKRLATNTGKRIRLL